MARAASTSSSRELSSSRDERASRESWGRSPECLEEGAGRRTPEKACGVDVLMWCSAFYDFADVRASTGGPRQITPRATSRKPRDRAGTIQHSREKTSRPGSRIPIPHRRPRAHGARSSDAQSRDRRETALSSRAAPRIASGGASLSRSGARCAGVTFCRLARRERRRHDGPTTSRPLVPRCQCRPGRPGAARGVRNR